MPVIFNPVFSAYVIIVNTDVVSSQTAGVTPTSSANIYDLTALQQVTPEQLFNHVLPAGGGNIYLVGDESDFEYYLDNYAPVTPPVNQPPALNSIGDETAAERELTKLTTPTYRLSAS